MDFKNYEGRRRILPTRKKGIITCFYNHPFPIHPSPPPFHAGIILLEGQFHHDFLVLSTNSSAQLARQCYMVVKVWGLKKMVSWTRYAYSTLWDTTKMIKSKMETHMQKEETTESIFYNSESKRKESTWLSKHKKPESKQVIGEAKKPPELYWRASLNPRNWLYQVLLERGT